MEDVTLELVPTGRNRWKIQVPGVVKTGHPNVDRHHAMAFAHLLAARVASDIGEDYDRRTMINTSWANGGEDIVLTYTQIGKTPPSADDLYRYTMDAIEFVVAQQMRNRAAA